MEIGPRYVQAPCSECLIAAVFADCSRCQLHFVIANLLFEGSTSAIVLDADHIFPPHFLQVSGQDIQRNCIVRGQDNCTLDDVLQLAHIARPGVRPKHSHRLRLDGMD